MATFTIDLLTGNLYLFGGNFNGSGSTPTSGSTYPQVGNFTELPPPASASGKIYVVRNGYGAYVSNRKPSGFYFSSGVEWRFLGETPDFFESDNFQIIDGVDTSKGVMFTTSGISTNVFRRLKIQNSDGTIAYLTDLNTKIDVAVFNDYTGTTAPATFLSKIAFNVYSGSTVPANYYSKIQINSYSGVTAIKINGKLDTSTFNTFTGSTGNGSKRIQVISTISANANSVIPFKITWSSASPYAGDTYTWSGGTSIFIKSAGTYEVKYHVLLQNDSANQTHNIGANLLQNDVPQLIGASAGMASGSNASGEISLPSAVLTLALNDRLDLAVFRIGTAGNANLVSGSIFLAINKLF